MLKSPLTSVLKLPCWWSIWLQNLLFFNPWWTSFTTFASGGLSGGLIWGLFRGLCWFSMFLIRTWVFGPVSFGLFSMFGFGLLQSDPKLIIPFGNSGKYFILLKIKKIPTSFNYKSKSYTQYFHEFWSFFPLLMQVLIFYCNFQSKTWILFFKNESQLLQTSL
jgi:hypothetical protein